MSKNENLNLADLDLKKLKLSEEDALALSYLTPGLSRRIQKQLLSQLAPSEVRKLHRTLSSRTSDESLKEPKSLRRSADRMSSTLPRRFSAENNRITEDNATKIESERSKDSNIKAPKSFLPVKNNRDEYKPSYEFNVRSSSIGCEPRSDNKYFYRRPKITKSLSVREPRAYSASKPDLQSPESSISESLSSSYRNNTDSIESSAKGFSDSSASRPYSKYSSDSSYSRYSPSKSYDSAQSFKASSIDSNKTDLKKPSSNSRRVSRFLRPDFFDAPKEENVYLKEKKEREMETQKVLKEIRDKRKGRLNMRRERSASREKPLDNIQKSNNEYNKSREEIVKETDKLLSNVSDSIKNLESNVKSIHDYVNVPANAQNPNLEVKDDNSKKLQNHDYVNTAKVLHDYVNVKAAENPTPVVKKEKISRIVRPKSYPTENAEKEKLNVSPEKESKLNKFRKGFSRQSKEKTKEDKNEANKNINEEEKGHKNKLLQSIEKKLEKFRTSSASKDPEEIKALQEKKSTVENAIRCLREQSLPRNLEHCTESGLIKRAVSVEDMSGSKPLQASRKSVTKILGLFKKYEEQENKRKEKVVKKTKNKENGKTNKPSEKESDKTTESVIINNNIDTNKVNSKEVKSNCSKVEVASPSDSSQSEKLDKKERPRSLLFDKVKHFQNVYNGAKSDTVLNNEKDKESKVKSKLPVNSFRRSLNLDNLPEPPKFYKNPSKTNLPENNSEMRPDRKNLKLDFSKVSSKKEPLVIIEPVPSTSNDNRTEDTTENRHSFTTTDESSTMLSPGDDYLSCDSWSVCSDFHHTNDLHSPVSPNDHIYSGDESESVIDRIRRKSFYTRFNEKKRPRKSSVARNYKDMDLGYKSPTDYSSLDRRTYDYKTPVSRRSSYASSIPEPAKEYKNYSRSSSLLNDYVNVPNRYQTYSSKIGRPASSIYSDSEDNALDDLLSTAKSRKYSPHIQPSRLGRTSVSPVNEYYIDRPPSVISPTTSEPI